MMRGSAMLPRSAGLIRSALGRIVVFPPSSSALRLRAAAGCAGARRDSLATGRATGVNESTNHAAVRGGML